MKPAILLGEIALTPKSAILRLCYFLCYFFSLLTLLFWTGKNSLFANVYKGFVARQAIGRNDKKSQKPNF
jgi:hypothetical protein